MEASEIKENIIKEEPQKNAIQKSHFEKIPLYKESECCYHWSMTGICNAKEKCPRAKFHTEELLPKCNAHPDRFYYVWGVPMDFKFASLLRRTLELNGYILTPDQSRCQLIWANTFIASVRFTPAPHTKLNHLPRHTELSHKDQLCKNMQKMHAVSPAEFNFVPFGFVFPQDKEKFVDYCSKAGMKIYSEESPPEEKSEKNEIGPDDVLWIEKPAGLGEGRGIQVVEKISGKILETPRETPCILQRYIHNPFLIEGKKIDFRLYVLVTSYYPTLQICLYKDAIVRFASTNYKLERNSLSNSFMHLCNNSVNVKNSQSLDDNWTLKEFEAWLEKKQPGAFQVLWKQFSEIATKTMLSAYDIMVSDYHKSENVKAPTHVYSLMGFDVLADENLKCWLLEVNSKPSLVATSLNCRKIYPKHFDVKTRLLADTFSIIHYLYPCSPANGADCPQGKELKIPPPEVLGGFECVFSEQVKR